MQLQANISQGQSSADIIYCVMYEEIEKESVPAYYNAKNNTYKI